jgi:AcrR family transcriptional regulator
MKPDGKAAQNKRIKKDALMRTAFELFSLNGIAKTTIAEIAEHAGVGKGTFYFYFKDKYDIRNHIIAHQSARIFLKAKKEIEVLPLETLEEKIIALTDHVINQLCNEPLTLRFVHKNLNWGIFQNSELYDVNLEGADFKGVFEEAFRESEVRYDQPHMMIFMIIELVGSTCYESILYHQPLPIDEMKPYLFDSIRAIMRSREIHENQVQ